LFKYILLFLIVFSKLSFADTEKISLDKLKLLMSEGVPLIDIRTAKEWQETGVIKDSHLITFFNENGEVDIYKWLNELELVADKNKPLILICRSGRRTGIVSDYLDKYFEFFNISIIFLYDFVPDWTGIPVGLLITIKFSLSSIM